jgi:phosphoserine phosphatase
MGLNNKGWKSMIRLACFDLDGTLVAATSTFHYAAEKLGFVDELTKYDNQASLVNNIQVAEVGQFESSVLYLTLR